METVWTSQIKRKIEYLECGLRIKRFNQDWVPEGAPRPELTEREQKAYYKAMCGDMLEREEFPEAAFICDQAKFNKSYDLVLLNNFLAVKGALAEVFAKANFGRGGLVPFPIYYDDFKTRYEEEQYYFLNFGCFQNLFLPPPQSDDEELRGISHKKWAQNGRRIDYAVAVTKPSPDGPDIWCDDRLFQSVFMKGWLVEAIMEAKPNVDLELSRCKVIDERENAT